MELETGNFKRQLKSIRILIYALMISILIASFGFALSVKKTAANLNQKDSQIHVLTDEIGQLKQENTFLNNAFKINRDIIHESFDILHGSIKDYDQFNEAKNELVTVISDKEFEIKSLQTQNQQLSNELQFHQYDSDIVNILVLGEHGSLTDTIILISINPKNKTITLINIPRDLYNNGRKINSFYASFGIERIIEEILKITGVYTEKYIIINFDAFVNMIDILGGVDIYVKEDIYDPSFPTSSNGHTVYEIEKGNHHFTGEEALMYSRSRKSTSDFDRAKRQQQIVQAIKDKLKKDNFFEDLDSAIDLYKTVSKSFNTNIDAFEALYYLNHFKDFEIESGNVISTQNLLYSSKTIDGQYILLPKTGDFLDIKKHISELIKN